MPATPKHDRAATPTVKTAQSGKPPQNNVLFNSNDVAIGFMHLSSVTLDNVFGYCCKMVHTDKNGKETVYKVTLNMVDGGTDAATSTDAASDFGDGASTVSVDDMPPPPFVGAMPQPFVGAMPQPFISAMLPPFVGAMPQPFVGAMPHYAMLPTFVGAMLPTFVGAMQPMYVPQPYAQCKHANADRPMCTSCLGKVSKKLECDCGIAPKINPMTQMAHYMLCGHQPVPANQAIEDVLRESEAAPPVTTPATAADDWPKLAIKAATTA